MAEKHLLNEDVTVKYPPQYPPQYPGESTSKIDESPPPYERPQIDFSSGWKDRGFAIAFWIHTIAVIIIGLVLGVPAITTFLKGDHFEKLKGVPANFDIKPILYGLCAAAGVAALSSFLTFFFLQLCSSRIVKSTFLLMIILQICIIIILFIFVFWPYCLIPGFFLLIILIVFSCVRKRISFAEAHLQAGCAALRGHPSLILIAFIMMIVQFLWFVFWFLMVIGIQNATNKSALIINFDTMNNTSNTTIYNITSTQPTFISTTISMKTRKFKRINGTRKLFNKDETSLDNTKNFPDESLERMNETNKSSSSSEQKWYHRYIHNIIIFILLLSWYWGSITFSNIAHFITACTVGQWWFKDDSNQQYTVRNSIKRALTTNFGTVCFGSLFEAVIKTFRSSAEDNSRKSALACLCAWILRIIEKVVGYLNEWAFIYSALTGQSFVEAGKSFINLFKKRGWTAILNDTIVGTTLGILNLIIGFISAIIGGLIIYIFMPYSQNQIAAIIIVAFISLLIGILMSTVVTTIVLSSVRTVFVCFALNPAALGATHPDHLQRLTKVWNKFYPQEFATSGYMHNLPQPIA